VGASGAGGGDSFVLEEGAGTANGDDGGSGEIVEREVVEGAEAKAARRCLARFPLDESASKSELVAALTERDRKLAESQRKVAARRTRR
jgi:hypothetical protein